MMRIVCLLLFSSLAQAAPVSVVDAVRTTLSLEANIKIAAQDVLFQQGAVRVGRAPFDSNLFITLGHRGDNQPLTFQQQQLQFPAANPPTYVQPGSPTNINTQTTTYSLGLSKQFRWGMTISPSLSLNRIDATGVSPPFGTARISFSIVQPLLRGRGAETVAARERAATLEEQASRLTLRHTIAQRILATAQAYWRWRAARETVAILMVAEKRAEELLAEEQQLVRGGEHPAADLKQLEANLADARTQLADAERDDVEQREALGIAMGVPWAQVAALDAPSSDLPSVDAQRVADGASLSRLAEESPGRRADLLSAEADLSSQLVLERAAERDREPQLDLQTDLGYTGMTEGTGALPFVAPIAQRVSGPNFFVNLNFAHPVENNAARGLLAQRRARTRQEMLQRDELRRTISSAVSVAAQSLRRAAVASASAEVAVLAYRDAVTNEKKKLRAGLSTNLDVILTEQRLTNAELALIRARARVADTLARLRFESGTLIDAHDGRDSVGLGELTTLP